MKKISIILSIALIIMVGCKKEKPFDFTDTTDNVEIYMPQSVSQPSSPVSLFKPILSTDPLISEIPFGAYFGGYENATSDISISFIINPDALIALNKAENAAGRPEYTLLPSSLYTIPSLTSVIKSGMKSSDVLKLIVNNKDIASGSKYALPITLKSASGGFRVSTKLNTTVYVFDVPDPWTKFAGNYTVTGRFTHPTPASSRDLNLILSIQYIGNQTYYSPVADLGSSNYYADLKVNIDNTVSITARGAMPNVDQTIGPNTFDPVTKTFTLNFSYTPPGGLPRIVSQKMIKQ
ncbi:DUF1735 domain-containing protein [Pedobacter rhodius]|uniref:DUF1735 domain-containing protein n=1 Tax=Pedobacter rhodius TaxID=3004098 RepID=A0ABT4KWZ7_9SPHI|nr:DUF1735 domain-containing protein [Pedobacter sp. SJ11]MCZ4223261.1 DUF1735 domain-containing protein [Pedobacter sp. SJ11]